MMCRKRLATAEAQAGHFEKGISQMSRFLTDWRKRFGETDARAVEIQEGFASILWKNRRFDDSVPWFADALKRRVATLGPDHPDTLQTKANLAVNVDDAGRNAEGIRLMEETLKTARGHEDRWAKVSWVIPRLVDRYQKDNQFAKAEALIREDIEAIRAKSGPKSVETVSMLNRLGLALMQEGKWAEAEPAFRECLETSRHHQPDSWITFKIDSNLGVALMRQKRFEEAEPHLVSGYDGMRAREAKVEAPNQPLFVETAVRIVELYEAWGKPEKAAAWRKSLRLTTELPVDPFTKP